MPKVNIGNELFREIFSVSRKGKLRKNHYMITVKDNSLFEQYFSRYSHESSDLKVTAALHGNSKAKKINGGILNFKDHLSEPHGISVCFSDKSTTFSPTTEDLNLDELPDSYGLIMQRVKLKGFIDVLKVLSEKKLVLRTNRDRYILSSSGLEIIESIINKHI